MLITLIMQVLLFLTLIFTNIKIVDLIDFWFSIKTFLIIRISLPNRPTYFQNTSKYLHTVQLFIMLQTLQVQLFDIEFFMCRHATCKRQVLTKHFIPGKMKAISSNTNVRLIDTIVRAKQFGKWLSECLSIRYSTRSRFEHCLFYPGRLYAITTK